MALAALNEIGASENATDSFLTRPGKPDGEPLNVRYTIFKNHVGHRLNYCNECSI